MPAKIPALLEGVLCGGEPVGVLLELGSLGGVVNSTLAAGGAHVEEEVSD